MSIIQEKIKKIADRQKQGIKGQYGKLYALMLVLKITLSIYVIFVSTAITYKMTFAASESNVMAISAASLVAMSLIVVFFAIMSEALQGLVNGWYSTWSKGVMLTAGIAISLACLAFSVYMSVWGAPSAVEALTRKDYEAKRKEALTRNATQSSSITETLLNQKNDKGQIYYKAFGALESASTGLSEALRKELEIIGQAEAQSVELSTKAVRLAGIGAEVLMLLLEIACAFFVMGAIKEIEQKAQGSETTEVKTDRADKLPPPIETQSPPETEPRGVTAAQIGFRIKNDSGVQIGVSSKCDTCGASYFPTKRTSRFCSTSCRNAHHNEKRSKKP